METFELTRSEVEALASDEPTTVERHRDGDTVTFCNNKGHDGMLGAAEPTPWSSSWDELLDGTVDEKTWNIEVNDSKIRAVMVERDPLNDPELRVVEDLLASNKLSMKEGPVIEEMVRELGYEIETETEYTIVGSDE